MRRAAAVCFWLLLIGAMGSPISAAYGGNEHESTLSLLLQRALIEQAEIQHSGFLYHDPDLEDYLNQIAHRLQPQGTPAYVNFRIKLIKDPHLNAFAYPDGGIYFHTGILARIDNEAQLAALMAHEISHCVYQHALKFHRYTHAKDDDTAEQPIRPAQGIQGLKDLFARLPLSTSRLSLAGYSRDLEAEADNQGLAMMQAAGYDPQESLRLFQLLQDEIKGENYSEPFLFGSHPNVRARLKACKDYIQHHWSQQQQPSRSVDVYLQRTKRLVLDNAWLDLTAGRFNAATLGVEKYLKLEESDGRAYFLMGEIARQQGGDANLKEAKGCYQKAISLDPDDPAPYKAMGVIYYKEGNAPLARRAFESCLAKLPNPQDAPYLLDYLERCAQ